MNVFLATPAKLNARIMQFTAQEILGFLVVNQYDALNSDHTYIAPDKCTECVGFYDEPQCIPACPTEAIIVDHGQSRNKRTING